MQLQGTVESFYGLSGIGVAADPYLGLHGASPLDYDALHARWIACQ